MLKFFEGNSGGLDCSNEDLEIKISANHIVFFSSKMEIHILFFRCGAEDMDRGWGGDTIT